MTSRFTRIGVPSTLAAALEQQGITDPTPIQAATLPDSLAGRDVLGRGRTGSGKSFAFLLPLVARLSGDRKPRQAKKPRALVLAPTRELATQLHESLQILEEPAGLISTVIFGGVNQNPQASALARGVDIVIACPGRLLDLMGQGLCDLSAIEITVIDEADHMADMGFLPGVRRILAATPKAGQRMLFSATLDAGVQTLVKQFLHDPVTHEADSVHSPVAAMEHHVLRIDAAHRTQVVADLAAAPGNTIVFTRTKHGARKLARQLVALGVPAVDLHGNLSQNARTRNLDAFHSGRVSTMVATDIAARGIHVDDVGLVVHADPPTEHKAYLHRSGRTARAGASGRVITLELPTQRNDVRTLLRQAKITATFAPAAPGADVLSQLAPGERTFLDPSAAAELSGAVSKPAHSARQTPARAQRSRRPGGKRNRTRGAQQRRGEDSAARPAQEHSRRARAPRPAQASAAGESRSIVDFSRSFR